MKNGASLTKARRDHWRNVNDRAWHTFVTWKDWYGREDTRRGVIVRLHRPAFTALDDALLHDGAVAIIGGP